LLTFVVVLFGVLFVVVFIIVVVLSLFPDPIIIILSMVLCSTYVWERGFLFDCAQILLSKEGDPELLNGGGALDNSKSPYHLHWDWDKNNAIVHC